MHEKGVVQCDMGCLNILLGKNDCIKFCDFGGSSIDGSIPRAEPDTDFQRPGRDDDTPDIQDDLCHLGSIIFEIWTGSPPSWSEPPMDRQRRFPDFVGVLPSAIITKCWQGNYHSATEIVTALEALREETNA
ncbi:hypothetical protein AYO20_00929 [Fonsecaea nubica]|uniref:Protein kinase domain-containing protein n=1 Tax=Fonsecaea nubica TaxID=856822 RepID=A0A178DE12_9EURO|nr:hypothetical protein AYO20_00929 [Fonsecaea nubica]OAL40016.1 hypothetical protein AYO20_00929 [Fonsecaea nubica]